MLHEGATIIPTNVVSVFLAGRFKHTDVCLNCAYLCYVRVFFSKGVWDMVTCFALMQTSPPSLFVFLTVLLLDHPTRPRETKMQLVNATDKCDIHLFSNGREIR